MPQNPRGQGPNSVQTVAGDKVVVVGDHVNAHPSLRTDPTGEELQTYGVTGSSGITASPTAIPTFEAVDNAGDFHGGNYTVSALNGVHLESAGGGTSIDSTGNVSINGWGGKVDITSTAQVGMKAQVVHIFSTNTVRVSGPTFYVDADEIVFAKNAQFGKNVMVNGGAFINGELFARHITCPHSVATTADSDTLYGYPINGASLVATISPVAAPPVKDGAPLPVGDYMLVLNNVTFGVTGQMPLVSVPPHNHHYDSIASTQTDGMTDFFEKAQAVEGDEPVQAQPNLPEDLSLSSLGDKLMGAVQDKITSYAKSMFGL